MNKPSQHWASPQSPGEGLNVTVSVTMSLSLSLRAKSEKRIVTLRFMISHNRIHPLLFLHGISGGGWGSCILAQARSLSKAELALLPGLAAVG